MTHYTFLNPKPKDLLKTEMIHGEESTQETESFLDGVEPGILPLDSDSNFFNSKELKPALRNEV